MEHNTTSQLTNVNTKGQLRPFQNKTPPSLPPNPFYPVNGFRNYFLTHRLKVIEPKVAACKNSSIPNCSTLLPCTANMISFREL